MGTREYLHARLASGAGHTTRALHVFPLVVSLTLFMHNTAGAAIKRDRLRVRNLIMKSTGFLEPGMHTEVDAAKGSLSSSRPMMPGGLSHALHSVGSPTTHSLIHGSGQHSRIHGP